MKLPNNIRIEIKDYNGNKILFQENFFNFEKKDIEYILKKIQNFLKKS